MPDLKPLIERVEAATYVPNETCFGTDPHNMADYCYFPCGNGLHLCGLHPDGNNFLTLGNVRATSPDHAQRLFDAAKAEFATAEGEPYDFVVDLQQDDDCNDDFGMTRQMLDRFVRALDAASPARPIDGAEGAINPIKEEG